ncbi:uncharacterized protein LOC105664977 [Ceratitis capitata]|uniref:uncharacterized protein LOC105664977 n=1 Tax=Ceratitis capitata TaxID=7213 RepID=UPI00061891B7|nr:uncharacterized protein LOC105664977 [Ceratitis capitata]XP_023159366.1 uncharacterized protein LOC105664977 [Ceratitis capitata]
MGGGVVFLIVVPTANFERELIYGFPPAGNNELPPPVPSHRAPLPPTTTVTTSAGTAVAPTSLPGNNNLNINLPESNNAILRLEVELRDKHAPKYKRGMGRGVGGVGAGRGQFGGAGGVGGGVVGGGGVGVTGGRRAPQKLAEDKNAMVPLEKVLEELLTKLEIEHVTWTTSRKGYFHHVVFPLPSGEPCETTLHCLTQLGIGTKLNSSVSIIPCSVTYDALTDPTVNKDDYSDDPTAEELSKWNSFVESIKSKLTVKQVVDGVRSGGSLSFDYLLLIVTADSLAALGLIENSATNIVAAMLVSPLMGPVMAITFGTIISDRQLVRTGFITVATGMFISILFGFIFGLLLGTTEMPWGSGDWPTEEMSGRGNSRSLWMSIFWALTSGTGVAVALLQGAAGPLIGVAISASLLPPMVNCGLFWALACIWLIYPGIRIPHLKGEPLDGNSSYPFLYTNYLPTEFFINGIISSLLTVINIICIFITAIIVLKIKEVSAPYTASPDLKRFWETDLGTVRKMNRSTMRRGKGGYGGGGGAFGDMRLPGYQGLDEPRNRELDTVLEQALKEAEDDVTFKKVKRMSYSSNAAGGELPQRLARMAGLNLREPTTNNDYGGILGNGSPFGSRAGSRMNSIRNSKKQVDLKALDKLISNLLEQHTAAIKSGAGTSAAPGSHVRGTLPHQRKTSLKLNRWRPTSRSAHSFNVGDADGLGGRGGRGGGGTELTSALGLASMTGGGGTNTMPTIMESGIGTPTPTPTRSDVSNSVGGGSGSGWTSSLERNARAARNALSNIANAPQRLSQGANNEETLNLTKNYVP